MDDCNPVLFESYAAEITASRLTDLYYARASNV